MCEQALTSIQVLIIELASPLRDTLVAVLESVPDLEVVGVGSSSREALRLTQRLRPRVIILGTLGLGAPGVQAIRQIMRAVPTAIVLMVPSQVAVSASESSNLDTAFAALDAGALTMVNEPVPSHRPSYDRLIETVRLMAEVPVVHRWGRQVQLSSTAQNIPHHNKRRENREPVEIIGVAASTGGPAALSHLLRNLPADFPLPIVTVQHVTHGFAGGLCKWLDSQTQLQVRVAQDGELLRPGTVLLSPDNYHLQISHLGKVVLTQDRPYKGLRPSANYLFGSIARAYGPRAMGVVLTGMGDDGVEGLKQLHQIGALTVAQDEHSSVVYGMPYAAVAQSAVEQVLSLEQIGELFAQLAYSSGPTIFGGGVQ